MRITDKAEASIVIQKLLIKTSFVLVKDIHHGIILGTPFINIIIPYKVNYDHIC